MSVLTIKTFLSLHRDCGPVCEQWLHVIVNPAIESHTMMNNNNLADYGIPDQMTMIYIIRLLIGSPQTGKVNPDTCKLEMKKTISSKTGMTFKMTEHPLTMLNTDPMYRIEKKHTKVPRSECNKHRLKSHLCITWFKAHPPDKRRTSRKKLTRERERMKMKTPIDPPGNPWPLVDHRSVLKIHTGHKDRLPYPQ